MNSSDIAKVLATKPKAVFMIKFGGRRSQSYCGRILETHVHPVSMDRYGYRLSRTRRVTTYTVEILTEAHNTQLATYEIKKHYSHIHAKDIDYVLDNGKTLEQLCEERTQNEREYRKRMATDAERKQELVTKVALTANIAEYELRTLTLQSLEKLVKALGDNDNTVLVSGQEE